MINDSMNKEKFHFHEYFNEGFGSGWGLYFDNKPTSYYIFLKCKSKDYELFYGNGFKITSYESLEFLKDLTIQIFKDFPKMSERVSNFNVEEFKNIKILASILINSKELKLEKDH